MSGPTELAVPSLLYPQGFVVHLSGGGSATPDAADQSVAVVVPAGHPHALCLAPAGGGGGCTRRQIVTAETTPASAGTGYAPPMRGACFSEVPAPLEDHHRIVEVHRQGRPGEPGGR